MECRRIDFKVIFIYVITSVLMCVSAYATENIPVLATAGFVRDAYNQLDTKIANKQDALTAGENVVIEGNIISAVDTKYDTGDTTTSGLTKLYDGIGDASDGALTQNAITTAILSKQDKLPMDSLPSSGKYSVVWDADNGKFIFTEIGTCVEDTPGLQCNANAGMYDIGFEQCIDKSTNGKQYGWYTFDGTQSNASVFDLSAPGSWGVEFDYGTVIGVASCNNTGGYYGATSDDSFYQTSTGPNCWCKLTYPVKSKWVYSGSASSCAAGCGNGCGYYFNNDIEFRSAILNSIK